MNRQQYDQIVSILRDEGMADNDKVSEINKVLDTDISDLPTAQALKEKLVGYDTMTVNTDANGMVTMSFGNIEVTGTSFAIAFIATLMNVIAARALDKFLPLAKPEKATGSRDGAAASPAGDRMLPAGIFRG